jgi:hypothetical protein
MDATVTMGGETLSLQMENISLNGMLCRPDRRIKAGEAADIRIVLSPKAIIVTRANIVRSDDEGIALAFTSVDESGFSHLKKLVQYNVDDADRVDRELTKAGF